MYVHHPLNVMLDSYAANNFVVRLQSER